MTGTNHLLSGAVIGVLIERPIVAVGVALASHVVADTLPHFGRSTNQQALQVLVLDGVCSLGIVVWLAGVAAAGNSLALLCGLVALAPDLIWIPYTIATHRGQTYTFNRLEQVLHVIQWGERPWGLIVEVPLAICLLAALLSLT